MVQRLDELLQACTVKIAVPGQGWGTGFFVAPGVILTCAHVVCKISRTSAPKSHPTSAGHSHELRQVKLIQPKPSARLR